MIQDAGVACSRMEADAAVELVPGGVESHDRSPPGLGGTGHRQPTPSAGQAPGGLDEDQADAADGPTAPPPNRADAAAASGGQAGWMTWARRRSRDGSKSWRALLAAASGLRPFPAACCPSLRAGHQAAGADGVAGGKPPTAGRRTAAAPFDVCVSDAKDDLS